MLSLSSRTMFLSVGIHAFSLVKDSQVRLHFMFDNYMFV